MLSYDQALAGWVENKIGCPVSDVFVDSMESEGFCGNDTCWYSGSVVLSFTTPDGERETRTFDIDPGPFVDEVAEIAKAAA